VLSHNCFFTMVHVYISLIRELRKLIVDAMDTSLRQQETMKGEDKVGFNAEQRKALMMYLLESFGT
jgi:hypothetical protein